MKCTNPYVGLPDYITKDGKQHYRVVPLFKVIGKNRTFEQWRENFIKSPAHGEPIKLPCGRCLACMINRSKDWTNRIMLESKYHDSSYFLTLTYDDEHLVNNNGDPLTPPELPSLYKKHLQDFWKRLRSDLDYKGFNKIRYFACGEYGSKSMRPHYHAIVFGLEIPDLKILKRSDHGDIYYTSEYLASLWRHGYVLIGMLTPETAGYVARYCTKKLGSGDSDAYSRYNLNKEFITCSRRPGIAKQYYDEYGEDLIDSGSCYVSTTNGGYEIRTPRYFKRLFGDTNPDLAYEKSLNDRHDVLVSEHYINKTYDGSELDHLKDIEQSETQKLQSLRRNKL